MSEYQSSIIDCRFSSKNLKLNYFTILIGKNLEIYKNISAIKSEYQTKRVTLFQNWMFCRAIDEEREELRILNIFPCYHSKSQGLTKTQNTELSPKHHLSLQLQKIKNKKVLPTNQSFLQMLTSGVQWPWWTKKFICKFKNVYSIRVKYSKKKLKKWKWPRDKQPSIIKCVSS